MSSSSERPSTPSLTLYQYPPAWEIASFDPACLQVQAYLRFAGLQYNIINSVQPDMSPSGELPFVDDGVHLIAGVTKIIHELSTRNPTADIDTGLSDEEKAEAAAFAELLKLLDTARAFVWWDNAANYRSVTRRLYATSLPFPLSFWVPASRRATVVSSLSLRPGSILPLSKDRVLADAARALAALSTRLGDRRFFARSGRPSVLDALVYGQLAVNLYAPMRDSELAEMINQHTNLVTHVRVITETYFGTFAPVVKFPPNDSAQGSKSLDAEFARQTRRQKRTGRYFVFCLLATIGSNFVLTPALTPVVALLYALPYLFAELA